MRACAPAEPLLSFCEGALFADGCKRAGRSLLCRTFDAGLAECCHEEGVGLLAYSPLAMGLLTVGQSLSNPYP